MEFRETDIAIVAPWGWIVIIDPHWNLEGYWELANDPKDGVIIDPHWNLEQMD